MINFNKDIWVPIEDDLSCKDPKWKRLSVPIDILMSDGTVHEDGFMTVDDKQFYTTEVEEVNAEDVVAWRTAWVK